ncbi:hypothetical protein [Streptomyces sp. NPDC002851]
MTAYRRTAAVAAAALLVSGLTVPAAVAATPDRAPAGATVAPQNETDITGGELRLDPHASADLKAEGIVTAGVGGAVDSTAGIALKVGPDSRIRYSDGRITGGTIKFKGGVQLKKGDERVSIGGFWVNLKTGDIIAELGFRAPIKVGSVDVDKITVTSLTQSSEGVSIAQSSEHVSIGQSSQHVSIVQSCQDVSIVLGGGASSLETELADALETELAEAFDAALVEAVDAALAEASDTELAEAFDAALVEAVDDALDDAPDRDPGLAEALGTGIAGTVDAVLGDVLGITLL